MGIDELIDVDEVLAADVKVAGVGRMRVGVAFTLGVMVRSTLAPG